MMLGGRTVGGGLRAAAVASVLLATTACVGGGDSEARTAVEQLRDALVTPDAEAVRALLADRSRSARTDLLTDEVVADNAFAGREVDIEADLDRFNGYGTFELVAQGSPPASLSVDLRLTSTTTPAALPLVSLSIEGTPDTILVDDHEVPLTSPDGPGSATPTYYLPPGTWTLALPASRFATTEPQEVEVSESRDRAPTVTLRYALTAAGRAEALAQAEAYVAACEEPTTSDEPSFGAGCGGDTSVCVGDVTTRTVTFTPRPRFTVGTERGPLVAAQDGLRRTVTTTCTDRASGAVTDTSTREGEARLGGTIDLTPPGLTVDLD